MILYVKYDFNLACKTLLKEHLDALGIAYTLGGLGEVEIKGNLTEEKRTLLSNSLKKYGIQILDDQKTTLVERIKNAIDELLRNEELKSVKVSTYLADTLCYSYAHLSSLFSESTYTSIENYIILRKVDLAKELMCNTDYTLTEIAYQLNYSSVAHLSGQFKKTTGLTPSTFLRIMKKKMNPSD
ncbi:helix-turn-helix domain-containing protein [Zobellia alginiliquefaciens]|uniref:helix-turn-helix domain-containing protein n=1 Tax=Zobellia alginiliquefaciens TaxID=3032586 RepID=UPI0023E335D7|nr:AraC family transcriptional regulator [Zobellia alginiliquefaciens]